jgi:hypothetical protein
VLLSRDTALLLSRDTALLLSRDTALLLSRDTALLLSGDTALLLSGDTALPIGVNLRSNPVRDCCLTIKSRSPLAPRSKGGTGVFSKSPQRFGGFRGI